LGGFVKNRSSGSASFSDIVERLIARWIEDMFPDVRNKGIDFYHMGGRLFPYDASSGFATHHKYASVIGNHP